MGNQIKQIIENFSKNECEKIKIRSEKKSKTKRKIKQISDKSKQSGGGMVDALSISIQRRVKVAVKGAAHIKRKVKYTNTQQKQNLTGSNPVLTTTKKIKWK